MTRENVGGPRLPLSTEGRSGVGPPVREPGEGSHGGSGPDTCFSFPMKTDGQTTTQSHRLERVSLWSTNPPPTPGVGRHVSRPFAVGCRNSGVGVGGADTDTGGVGKGSGGRGGGG